MTLHSGVYVGLPGPSLETKAEYQYLHTIGADLVGMSIVPEVIAAAHAGLDVIGLCVVSNVCYPPENITETTIGEVVAVVSESATKVATILNKYLASS